jgi:hypothetical protein
MIFIFESNNEISKKRTWFQEGKSMSDNQVSFGSPVFYVYIYTYTFRRQKHIYLFIFIYFMEGENPFTLPIRYRLILIVF